MEKTMNGILGDSFADLIDRLCSLDESAIGRPKMASEDRGLALGWACRLLVYRPDLDDHISFLQKRFGRDIRHQELLSEEQAERVVLHGADVLFNDELASLLLNPIALHDLACRISEELPDYWLDRMSTVGRELLKAEEGGRVTQVSSNEPQPAMTRTIIDILRKGNQELFHSSVIAWLLDPRAEHGYGRGCLDAFARLVKEKGDARFQNALQTSPEVKITTETAARKSRYDIKLEVGNTLVVIENKTKTLGDDPQFEKYNSQNVVLVALGLCEMSFSEQVKGKYPLVTYADVLGILDRLPDAPASDFKVLVDHYRQFLKRELAILAEIDLWYSTSDPAHASRILELVDGAGTYTKNDRRFLNLYLLERLRRDLLASPRWKHCQFKMDKNMKSGVWLTLKEVEKEAGVFGYEDAIVAVCKDQGASIWLHVELWDGILARDGKSTAGVMQLRCEAKNAKTFVEGFRQARPLRGGENYSARMKKQALSFYLLARPLLKRHLTSSQFIDQLD